MVLPLDEWLHPLDATPRVAAGVLRVRVLCAQRLPAADLTGYSNPFVILSIGDQRAKSAVRHQTLQPVWNDEFCMLVPDRRASMLRLQVLDFNPTKVHDLLGTAELRMSDVHNIPRTAWLRLEMPRNSKQAEWLVTCSGKSYDKATEAARIAVQVVYAPLSPFETPNTRASKHAASAEQGDTPSTSACHGLAHPEPTASPLLPTSNGARPALSQRAAPSMCGSPGGASAAFAAVASGDATVREHNQSAGFALAPHMEIQRHRSARCNGKVEAPLATSLWFSNGINARAYHAADTACHADQSSAGAPSSRVDACNAPIEAISNNDNECAVIGAGVPKVGWWGTMMATKRSTYHSHSRSGVASAKPMCNDAMNSAAPPIVSAQSSGVTCNGKLPDAGSVQARPMPPEDPIASELGMTPERWAELYENGSIVLKSGILLKSNRRHNNYRERWAELELSIENDHTRPGASTARSSSTLSAQLRYYKLEMPSGGWNPLRGVFAAVDSALDFMTLSALASAPALSRETAEQFGRRCQGTIRIEEGDHVTEGPWQRSFLCAAPQVVCVRKPGRLWYLRATGGREGRSWLKALHLSRELVAGNAQRERLLAAARQQFEARASAQNSESTHGPAGCRADRLGMVGSASAAGALHQRAALSTGTTCQGPGRDLASATTLVVGAYDGRAHEPVGTLIDAESLGGTAVAGMVAGVVLVVELLEARALDSPDPIGGCNPYAVIEIGPHQVLSEPLYDTTEPQWGRSWQMWGGARDARYAHLCGGFCYDDGVLTVRLMSERRSGGVDALGIARMTLSSVFEGPSDMWIPLDLVSTGEVRLRVTPYNACLPSLGGIPTSFSADLLLDGPQPRRAALGLPPRSRHEAQVELLKPEGRVGVGSPPMPSAGTHGRLHSMPSRQHTAQLELELLGAASRRGRLAGDINSRCLPTSTRCTTSSGGSGRVPTD